MQCKVQCELKQGPKAKIKQDGRAAVKCVRFACDILKNVLRERGGARTRGHHSRVGSGVQPGGRQGLGPRRGEERRAHCG